MGNEVLLTEDKRREIERELENWNSPKSKARKRFEAAKEKYDKLFKGMEEACEAATNITERDLMITFLPLKGDRP